MSKPVKIGAWGGTGGRPRDIKRDPSKLVRVIVHSGWAIDSIQFTYKDKSGNLHEAGPWGGDGGDRQPTVELENSEYVKEISGTYGDYYGRTVVTSLKFVTTKGKVHNFGKSGSGGSFHIPLPEGQIVGFFGRGGDLIDAIGVYVLP